MNEHQKAVRAAWRASYEKIKAELGVTDLEMQFMQERMLRQIIEQKLK